MKVTDAKLGAIITIPEQQRTIETFDAQAFLATNKFVKNYKSEEYLDEKQRFALKELSEHLFMKSETKKLRELLTKKFDFVAAQVAIYGIQRLIDDYANALKLPAIRKENSLQSIQEAIQLATYLLTDDPSQLPEQLLARLLVSESTDVQQLLEQAKSYKSTPWLCPLTSSLMQPNSPLLRTITSYQGLLHAIAITPDGKCFVSADDTMLKVWLIESGEELFTLTGYNSQVTDLTITPDNQFVVAALREGSIKVWRLENQQEIFSLSNHSSAVLAIATLPDNHLLSASTDNTLKIWDLNQGLEICTLNDGHGGSCNAVAVLPDGKHVIAGYGSSFGASDEHVLKIWDLEEKKVLYTLTGHEWPVNAVAVTPNGRYAIAAVNEKLKVWDLTTQTAQFILTGHTSRIHSVVAPNDKWVISTSSDDTLKVWEIEQGQELLTLKGHHGLVSDVAIAPNKQHAFSTSYDQTIKIWDLNRIEKVVALSGHTDSVEAVVVTPDAQRAISASKDHTLIVWDMQLQKPLLTLKGHTHWVTDVAVMADSHHALSASWDGTLKLWDIETGQLLLTLLDNDEHIERVAVTSNGQYAVFVPIKKSPKVWDIERKIELFTFEGHEKRVNDIAITTDDKRVISASDDHTLKVWNIETGMLLHTLQSHSEYPAFPLENEASEEEQQKYLLGQGERKNAVAVMPDGRNAVSGSQNGILKIWNIENNEKEIILPNDGASGITDIAVTPNGRFAFATSGLPYYSSDNMLRVWDLETQQLIAYFVGEMPMKACAVAPDGVTVVVGDAGGQVHFLRLENGVED